ncbi:MAG: TrmB family transcriptional regulator [Candidatus Thorarchaeota archaeon]
MNESIKEAIESSLDAFMKLGFTRYESLILAILTAQGTSTVKEIHEFTDVPLPKVYQTLDSLKRKNLIKEHSKIRPVQYTAYSPDIIIRRVQDANRESEEKLKEQLEKLSDHSEKTFTGDIAPFTGFEAMKRIVRGILQNCQNEISVAMSINTLKLFSDDIEELKRRDISLRSMMYSAIAKFRSEFNPKEYETLGFSHKLVDVPIQLSPNLKFFNIMKKLISVIDYLGIIISDNGEAVILLPLFPNETYFGIWISSSEIIQRQLVAYNELYKIGK